MNKRGFLEEFEKLNPMELSARIQEEAVNIEESQNTVLMDILECAKDSEYGRKYHFSDIHSVEEFQKNVPITEFADYKDMIERMKKGEENILFPGKPAVFLNTSGTTGTSKYIPETQKGGLVKKIVSNIRMFEIAKAYPKIANPDYKVFAIMNSAVYGTTEGGIPVGSASGQSTKSGGSESDMSGKMPLPSAVLSAPELSTESMDYLTLLYGISCESVSALFCNNVAHVNVMFRNLNKEPGRYLNDIRTGTFSIEIPKNLEEELLKTWKPNPQRADKLEALYEEKGRLNIADIWPEFDFVGCWLSASVGRTLQEVKSIFPEKTMYFDWGYGASEGKYNIPMHPNKAGGLLTTFGYFYEFLPIGQKTPVLLQDTRDGEKYELVMTSYSGFYRYNIHDIVKITVNPDGSRNIEFICKSGDKTVIGGNTLYASDLTDIIENFEKEHSIRIRLFQGKAEDEGLRLLVEPIEDFDRKEFETFVRQGFEKFGISLSGVEYKEEGYRDSLFSRSLKNGKTVNQTKLPVFIS